MTNPRDRDRAWTRAGRKWEKLKRRWAKSGYDPKCQPKLDWHPNRGARFPTTTSTKPIAKEVKISATVPPAPSEAQPRQSRRRRTRQKAAHPDALGDPDPENGRVAGATIPAAAHVSRDRLLPKHDDDDARKVFIFCSPCKFVVVALHSWSATRLQG